MHLKNKKVLVVGLGVTGEALCRFLLNQGADVRVSEKRSADQLGDRFYFWSRHGLRIETGGHSEQAFLEADMIVTSPGVPTGPAFEAAAARGIPIISEVEMAFHFLRGRIVGITGSNGKSTTTTLVHKILRDAGYNAFLAGNIRTPLISFTEQSREDHLYVTELSSFQLEHIRDFRAEIGIFLNLTPDHIDWHKSMAKYFEAKSRLITGLSADGTAILNRDDPEVWGLGRDAAFKVYGFSREKRLKKGCYLEGGDRIILADRTTSVVLRREEIPLPGIHNLENIMAAILAAHNLDVPVPGIAESIREFQGLEHRLEKVLTFRGIEFYNDSKATNVDATLKSMMSFEGNIILILGGRDKGGDFSKLNSPIKDKVKAVLLIGEAAPIIEKALNGTVPVRSVHSMKEAVGVGFTMAESGDTILLAPACTSFDMYPNFEERGRVFKSEAFSLKAKLDTL